MLFDMPVQDGEDVDNGTCGIKVAVSKGKNNDAEA
jgi:hypothetical protein